MILNPSSGETTESQEQATTLVSSLPTDASTISATAYSELVYSQAVAAVTAQQQFQGGQLLAAAPVLTPVTPKQENGENQQQQKQPGSGGKGITIDKQRNILPSRMPLLLRCYTVIFLLQGT